MLKIISIEEAVNALKNDQLVAMPTETVYGLATNARSDQALENLFTTKNRPKGHPVIIHIASLSELSDWCSDVPENALKLANQFWPGPLTLVLKKNANVSTWVTGEQDTVAIRMPNHPIALKLIQQFGSGIAAPSANRFSQISPTSASAVQQAFSPNPPKTIAGIIEGGNCSVGIESTIIDFTADGHIRILRPGILSEAELQAALLQPNNLLEDSQEKPWVPGAYSKHYSPEKPCYMVDSELITQGKIEWPQESFSLIYYSEILPSNLPEKTKRLKLSNQPSEYAQKIYQALREAQTESQILIEAPPKTNFWQALWDRLQKASCGKWWPQAATIIA